MTDNNNNILKRKNEDSDSLTDDQINKRVALDSEQLDISDKQQEDAKTAPIISNGGNEPEHESDEEYKKDEGSEENGEPDKQEESEGGHLEDDGGEEEMQEENQNNIGAEEAPKPVSNHREKESDPTYVLFRMYCPVKEASTIVGKKGEKINHIRDKANVRINVSENLKNVPERIILVRGPAENVAKAFGLIARTILEEPEDEPASILSRQYNLKLLVPHPMVGFIIGKQGVKFREIEDSSAAKLKAAEQPLPYSTDRILSITGVGDAIHIAIYYISQVMIEHKDCLKKNKVVYYNPANYHHNNMNMMNVSMMQPNTNMYMGSANALTMQALKDVSNPYAHQVKQPYNFQMMFQPSVHPQHQFSASPSSPMAMPAQTQYTDEHGNNVIGDVIVQPPVQVGGKTDKFYQDVFVANANIGSVIGKGGHNIKQIRENSGCTYVKIEPDQRQSIMLGGGRGLTNIRKLTLTGSLQSIQIAIYLINQRIGTDKERNAN